VTATGPRRVERYGQSALGQSIPDEVRELLKTIQEG
jgi:hypothetical protein